MTDRHKDNPIPFRPPAGERAWLTEHAKRTGKAVNAILTAALAAYREHHEKEKP
jgi:hypothetical protein